jgi:hypothetical protein
MPCSSVEIHLFQGKMLPPSSRWQSIPPNVSEPLPDYTALHSRRWYSSEMLKLFRNSGEISIFHTLQESTMDQEYAALEYTAGLERLQLTVISHVKLLWLPCSS